MAFFNLSLHVGRGEMWDFLFSRFGEQFVSLSGRKSFFLRENFMFQALEYKFQVLEYMFQALKHKFQALEWKFVLGGKTFSQGGKKKFYPDEKEKPSFPFRASLVYSYFLALRRSSAEASGGKAGRLRRRRWTSGRASFVLGKTNKS